MAPLPLGRIIAQVIVPLVAVLARALPAAYNQALNNARKQGVDASAKTMIRKTISKEEALQILNIELPASKSIPDPKEIQKQYDRYFEANSVEKGGSFYLQSKIVRAKEMLDEYVKEAHAQQTKQSSEGGP
mmetsp:Transcript_45025/g.66858  ORF Transcript_45025/g.66858 Transcript_45025/m.66858 type:complete len:131 (+) Transcript_45025:147-539(+)